MLSIARAELIQIFRNRLVLVTSLIMPAAVSALFIRQHETWAEMASLATSPPWSPSPWARSGSTPRSSPRWPRAGRTSS